MDAGASLPLPPRTVRGGPPGAIWVVRIFLLPHTLVGLFVTAMLAMTVALALVGTDATAIVLSLGTHHHQKGGTTYSVKYRYIAGGLIYTNSGSISRQLYDQLSSPRKMEGDPIFVKVRYLRLGPVHHQVLVQEHSAWQEVGFLVLFTLFWNAVMSVFLYAVWIVPLRERWLVRNGTAISGEIVKTRVATGRRSTTYYATFRFTDPRTAQEIKREMGLPGRNQYEQAQAGGPITVLYDPDKPKRAIAYELGYYRVESREVTGDSRSRSGK